MGLVTAILMFFGVAAALWALPAVAGDALAALGITETGISTALVLLVSAAGVGASIHSAMGFLDKRRRKKKR